MDTFARLRDSQELTENDRAIVSYLLDHAEEVTRLSSRELARRTHTSASGVLRLSRRLGYESFNDLKVNIASDLKRANPGTTVMCSNEQALSACAKAAELDYEVVRATRESISLDAVQQAADILGDCEQIDVCARESNSSIARYVWHLFSHAGRLVTVRDTIDQIVRMAPMTPSTHAALLISRGGKDNALIGAARLLKERNVPTVLLTTALKSELAELCDVRLQCLYGRDRPWAEVTFHASARYVVNAIYAILFSDAIEEHTKFASEFYKGFNADIFGDGGWDRDAMSQV